MSDASLFLILSTLYKIHNETSLLSYFSVKKSTKSHLRGLSSLLKIFFRVHELVARAMRGECVRQRTKRKSAILPLSEISYYHACEHSARGSRADSCTHCLHARWIMGGGRGSDTYADGTIKINFILICSNKIRTITSTTLSRRRRPRSLARIGQFPRGSS